MNRRTSSESGSVPSTASPSAGLYQRQKPDLHKDILSPALRCISPNPAHSLLWNSQPESAKFLPLFKLSFNCRKVYLEIQLFCSRCAVADFSLPCHYMSLTLSQLSLPSLASTTHRCHHPSSPHAQLSSFPHLPHHSQLKLMISISKPESLSMERESYSWVHWLHFNNTKPQRGAHQHLVILLILTNSLCSSYQ